MHFSCDFFSSDDHFSAYTGPQTNASTYASIIVVVSEVLPWSHAVSILVAVVKHSSFRERRRVAVHLLPLIAEH
ncbi:hypothetical protein JHK82_054798 [Glycine max]|uniref:Uncharacterized protein n=2 Tax=Glycine subgen. Soja TaxID=1462606 RepID=K7N0I4_SOYBN|nr:hypothetical protein JHK86_054645 [Glycine max]KAG4908761.1 hypothetical protein JHK87_054877 [Glycine soja]KAG5073435.1 hypothetical protein JHK84_054666 [Glycine max]KAG5076103.1 hypothetical protein JHK82_054798 [Glycine max]KAH1033858.1 hypothetical protein GYH30_054326 [Glycine max]